jgi:putative cardiolipin synthase
MLVQQIPVMSVQLNDCGVLISTMSVFIFLLVGLLAIFAAAALSVYLQAVPITAKRESYVLNTSNGQTEIDRYWQDISEQATAPNALALIDENIDAFAGRVISARLAGRSLDLMYYMWNADLTGTLLTKELIDAADRGVRVRLLIDDLGASISDRAFHALDQHRNIELRLFNPTRARENRLRRAAEMVLRFRSVNRRMHNKAWIADGRVLITGGRNIGDAYFDAGEHSNFRDFDLIAYGKVVQDAEEIFDDYWNSSVSVPIRSLLARRKNRLAKLRSRLNARARSPAAKPYIDKIKSQFESGKHLALERLHWTDHADVLADPPEKAAGKRRRGRNFLMESLMPLMDATRSKLQITSPYFVPGQQGCQRLSTLAERGVDVQILTNSLAATDVAAVHAGYARYRKSLLSDGVRLFELRSLFDKEKLSLRGSGQASLHTKAFARDDELAFIGSLNFDPRSASLNTEMGIVFQSEGLISEMNEIFAMETQRVMSFEVMLSEKDRLVWKGMVHSQPTSYTSEPYASISRRAIAAFMRLLPLESQL